MMVTETKQETKTRKKRNTLKVVKVEFVQVPDANERLNRVFKMLLSSFKNIEKNEAKRR